LILDYSTSLFLCILIAYSPAGKMETFFHEIKKANALPPLGPICGKAMA